MSYYYYCCYYYYIVYEKRVVMSRLESLQRTYAQDVKIPHTASLGPPAFPLHFQ